MVHSSELRWYAHIHIYKGATFGPYAESICYDLWWWWWWWWWWWSFYNLFVAPTYGLRDGVLTMSSNSKKLVQQHHLVSNLKFALHEGIQNCTRTLTELPSGSMFVECSAFRLSCSATRIPGKRKLRIQANDSLAPSTNWEILTKKNANQTFRTFTSLAPNCHPAKTYPKTHIFLENSWLLSLPRSKDPSKITKPKSPSQASL